MCNQDVIQPLAMHAGKPPFEAAPPAGLPFQQGAPFATGVAFGKATGSRRRRLWELPHHCHCPVVGVCLPLGVLRALVNKALGGQAVADDYEIHVGAVAECGCKNKLSVALQKVLEQRYAVAIMRFKTAKTARELAQLWTHAIEAGDITGAFWAALTHPRCDAVLQEVVCRDMHMLQHQAGATVRMDMAKFKAVMAENAVLARELGRVQERVTLQMAEKTGEIEKLKSRLMLMQAANISKDSEIAFLTADMAHMKAAVPDLDARTRLQKKLDQLAQRELDQQVQILELRHKLASAEQSLQQTVSLVSSATPAADTVQAPPNRVIPIKFHLQQKSVLCVGGRSGNVSSYRDVVERVGGRFAHHDGGLEDNQHLLDASLAAADLVICQTGCISHNAYWRVKDFCKRTGKQCVFVENPSASSLARGLEQFSASVVQADGVLAIVSESSSL